jgi:alpha-L-fucosidase
MGRWLNQHGRSIYGCTAAPPEFKAPSDCRLTYQPDTNRLYLHLFAWPFRHLHLDGFAGKVKYAQLLNDASEIAFVEPHGDQAKAENEAHQTLTLSLPVQKPNVVVPVIELFLD